MHLFSYYNEVGFYRNMSREALKQQDGINRLVESFLLPKFINKIDESINFISSYKSILNSYYKKLIYSKGNQRELLENLISFHSDSLSLLSKKFEVIISKKFDQEFTEFVENASEFFASLNKKIIRVQEKERFIIQPADRGFLLFRKRIKIIFFNIAQLPRSVRNQVRKLFKKPLEPLIYWKHTVPYRNLLNICLIDSCRLSLIPVMEEINQRISNAFFELRKLEEEYLILFEKENDIVVSKEKAEEISKSLIVLKNSVTAKIRDTSEDLYFKIEDAYYKVGTIELSLSKFSEKKGSKKKEQLNDEYKSLSEGWGTSFFALFDDWRLDKELYLLRGRLKKDYMWIKERSREKVDNNIKPKIVEISDFLKEIKYKFEDFSGGSSELKTILFRERDRIYNKLSLNVIPRSIENILNQDIPGLINELEMSVNAKVEDLSEKRAIAKTGSYLAKLKESDIDYISPFEIITFSTLPSFTKNSTQIKSRIMLNLEEIQKGILDIDQIADFNLDSALSMFKSDRSTFEDPVDIAIEGIDRAIAKKDLIEEKLKDIEKDIDDSLFSSVESINEDLVKLTRNENILDIKLKITKDKAVYRTQLIKKNIFDFVKNFFPQVYQLLKKGFTDTKGLYRNVKTRLGFVSKPVSISTEIADFLAETEIAISKLPFVYQRLFRIEPLEDERFFEGREKELSHLKEAYKNWKLKRYAPVIIYGEKGSGITTLLNFYFKNLEANYNIIRTRVETNIYTEKDFIDFLKNIFKKSNFNNVDDVTKYLNELVTKRIVVIENLQNLFLKKVNGFVCLRMLFELISKTNQNVLWIISSSQYAWEYLTKVMNVTDYFGYHVKLEKLSDKQMIDIILKRHRISGYNIYFEPDAVVKKKYKKLSDVEIQEHLKKEYFSELNEFAKSNISLALLYWMRSTEGVTANTIKLSSVAEIDFSFFKAMNPEKFFILYLLLLHDGLTEEDVVEIYNRPLKEVRLNLLVLLDDGIIIRRGSLYIINPLLYRQIVYLLQSKNIIH